MQMSDMVERLTVVLGEQLAAAFTSGKPVVLSKVVRAMLENMREPTDAMCEAAEWHQQSEVNQYQQAIDAELK